MNLDDLFEILHLAIIMTMFSNGLSCVINPIDWYGYIFGILFFLLSAFSLKLYQQNRESNQSQQSKRSTT